LSRTAEQSLIEGARSAFASRSWEESYKLLTQAAELGPDDLERLAESAWWTGRLEDSITARQKAYSAYLSSGQTRKAAYCAVSLAVDYMGKLAHSMGKGWMKRAERLLENDTDCPEYGWLLQVRAYVALSSGEYERALDCAQQLLELGAKFAEPDLLAYGVMAQGRVKLAGGEVDQGLELLDEAILAAVSGELSPKATGLVYCMAIVATASLRDYRRAGEWTEAAKRWCERQSISGFPGTCRVHRAQIMHLRGAWAEAEQDVRLALNELKDFNLTSAGEGFDELGEIRLRMGDLKGAGEAFRQAEALGIQPGSGAALLRLAEGDVTGAATAIKRALAEEVRGPLHRFPFLAAQAEIALAAGDYALAESASQELDQIAAAYGTSALLAAAAAIRGTLQAILGDPQSAVSTLREALRFWKEADIPYETARTRVRLSKAYELAGEPEVAAQELEVARSAFQRLGAALDLRQILPGQGEKSAESRGSRVVKTFVFTDIVMSTNLVEAIGDESWSHLLEWHNKTLRSLFLAHGGEEIKQVGDGFFVAFDQLRDALECAVAIQRTLSDHRRAHGFAPKVRIGLHTGEAARRDNDYEGKQIHLAARIGATAGGDEILVSASSIQDVPASFQFTQGQPVTLRGLAEPVEVAYLDWR
jgi:class 3 adenylate cyclase